MQFLEIIALRNPGKTGKSRMIYLFRSQSRQKSLYMRVYCDSLGCKKDKLLCKPNTPVKTKINNQNHRSSAKWFYQNLKHSSQSVFVMLLSTVVRLSALSILL